MPDQDIKIVFTGLRPGEKLSEDLVGRAEEADLVPGEQVFRVNRQPLPDLALIEQSVERLCAAAAAGDRASVLAVLTRLVPTFQRADPVVEPVPAAGRAIALSSNA